MITVEERDVKIPMNFITPVLEPADEMKADHDVKFDMAETSQEADHEADFVEIGQEGQAVREWDEAKPHLESIYFAENKSLRETRLLMIERFGFDAS